MVVPAGVSDYSTVTASNQVFASSMSTGNIYLFSTTVACFVAQHATAPVASAAAGSILVPAGSSILLHGDGGVKLGVIRDTVDGKATLTPVRRAI